MWRAFGSALWHVCGIGKRVSAHTIREATAAPFLTIVYPLQRSIQSRIDQAPGVVSKKIVSIPTAEKSVAKPPLPQQVFEKKPEAPPPIKKPADPKAEIREVEAGVQLSWEDAESRLREWDMNSRFGPCMSMTRLERWKRAEKLDIDPPIFIYNVIRAFPELKDKSVWHGRVQPEEKIIGV